MSDKPLVLVDGSSYLYRAFYALPPLTNRDGEPTGAIYGVGNMLRRLIADYDPENIAVVFDAKGKTFRDELFEQYKAHRPPMPEDLSAQVEPLHRMVAAMGLPLLQVSGVEADDVIGTLARQAREQGIECVISTGDKDMAQLVDGNITLINTMTNTVMDRPGVRKKFGVEPEQIVDYLALVGDKSDNIPGVPKVGPKTAAKWLNEYGSLDELVRRADEIKGKVGESLRDHLEELELSRQLATIRQDVPLDKGPADLQPAEPRVNELREFYRHNDFSKWLAELDEGDDAAIDGEARAPASVEYETVLDEATLETWVKALEKAELFAFDTETTSLNYIDAELVGVSFAVEANRAAYVPVAHSYADAPAQLDREAVLERLRPLLEDPARAKVGHHLKYDAHVLANHGIRLQGITHDTMLESYVLDSTGTRHDMDSVAQKYLGVTPTSYEAVAGKGAKQKRFDEVDLESAAPYAAEDADITLRLHRAIFPRLEAEPRLASVYTEIEMPLVPVLTRMEERGVMVDTERLADQSRELGEEMRMLEEAAHKEAGRVFNLGSPKQLQQILFEELELPVVRRTPKGQPSTAEDVLQDLAGRFELPRLILEYRGMSKLRSTYTDRLPEQVNPKTDRVHTSYHQAVTATGRLSSSDPNLQNIPIRTPAGRRVRQAFVAPDGYRLMAADYSQIELRIMAHLSGDDGLLRAFENDLDIHRATAAEVFGADPDAVTGEQRRSAKAINFGLIYGMSAWGLGRQLGIDRGEAQSYVDRYFERYPGVREFMDRTRETAREDGFVETVFGRRLYVPEIRSRNPQRRQYAERTAINAPMQGTAADIIKRAMIEVDTWLEASDVEAWMVMQVHDELVLEVPEAQVEAVADEVRGRMSAAARLAVPLKVDVGVGANWDEAH